MSKIAARAFPAFAVGFALFYAPAYSFTTGDAGFNWSLFTYFPSVGDYGELRPALWPEAIRSVRRCGGTAGSARPLSPA